MNNAHGLLDKIDHLYISRDTREQGFFIDSREQVKFEKKN